MALHTVRWEEKFDDVIFLSARVELADEGSPIFFGPMTHESDTRPFRPTYACSTTAEISLARSGN